MAVQLRRRVFSVEEYDRMGLAGILTNEDRVELVRGEIVQKVTIGNAHRGCVNRLMRMLRGLEDRAYVQAQAPVVVLADSKPEPDIALIAINEAAVGKRPVYASDIFAIVEVADASRDVDVHVKGSMYAEGGVREYWVVDLIDRVVRVSRDPEGGRYRTSVIAHPRDEIAFEAFPSDPLSVDQIIGDDLSG